MKKHRNRPLAGWILLLLLAVILIGGLFGLEYLGSEKKQRLIDQPVVKPISDEAAG